MKKLPLIVGAVVLLAGVGGAAYFFLLKGSPAPSSAEKVRAGRAAAAKLAAERKLLKKERLKLMTEGPTVRLADEFVVNLEGHGLTHYAKFSVAIQVDEGTPMHAAGGHGDSEGAALEEEAEVRDIIIDSASEFSADELARAAGRERLKHAIEKTVTKRTQTIPLEVFFTSFAVQ
jgi:flagellar basal body-associated protein FliL